MNLKIKFRESFRPFAPVVLQEHCHEWFDMRPGQESPYMLLVAPVRDEVRTAADPRMEEAWGIDKLNFPRSAIPAVTHVDYSARVQTVSEETSPEFHALLRAFEALTGCPVLVNTSFNVRGEPIVCSPADAYRCFMRTNIDYLVLGPFVLAKSEQNGTPGGEEARAWQTEFQLD
jgi:carbamoyltransferase